MIDSLWNDLQPQIKLAKSIIKNVPKVRTLGILSCFVHIFKQNMCVLVFAIRCTFFLFVVFR